MTESSSLKRYWYSGYKIY